MPEIFFTNLSPNFTGISAAAATTIRSLADSHDIALVGNALPGCPPPITLAQARRLCRTRPQGRPFALWHLRRPAEIRAGLWARDVLLLPVRLILWTSSAALLDRWVAARMDAVIASDDATAAALSGPVTVIPPAVDTELFHPAPDRTAAWQATGFGGHLGIASIGRIRPENGTDTFVEAMLGLLPDFPDTTALVVGRAGRKHLAFDLTLKDRVQRAGLVNRIRFTGELAPETMPSLMQALSLVLHLPRRATTCATVPLEALAAGTPLVLTEGPSHRALAKAAVLVPPQAANAAAVAARALLEDPLGHSSAASAARTIAVTRFSAQAGAVPLAAVHTRLWDQP